MTDPQRNLNAFLAERFRIWATTILFTALTGVGAWVFTPIGEKVAAIWNSPEHLVAMQVTLQSVATTVDELRAEVAIARAPGDIVEYGPASGFQRPCKASATCYLVLEIRRVSPAAEGCKIIAAATKREILSPERGYVWEPDLAGGVTRDATGRFVLNEVSLALPATLKPGEYFYRQTTYYDGCPWQDGGKPPVSSVSPLIPMIVTE